VTTVLAESSPIRILTGTCEGRLGEGEPEMLTVYLLAVTGVSTTETFTPLNVPLAVKPQLPFLKEPGANDIESGPSWIATSSVRGLMPLLPCPSVNVPK